MSFKVKISKKVENSVERCILATAEFRVILCADVSEVVQDNNWLITASDT